MIQYIKRRLLQSHYVLHVELICMSPWTAKLIVPTWRCSTQHCRLIAKNFQVRICWSSEEFAGGIESVFTFQPHLDIKGRLFIDPRRRLFTLHFLTKSSSSLSPQPLFVVFWVFERFITRTFKRLNFRKMLIIILIINA